MSNFKETKVLASFDPLAVAVLGFLPLNESSRSSFFDLSFWQGFVITFIGAGLAILTALWLDRIIQHLRGKQEKQHLKNALRQSIDNNMSILNQLEEALDINNPIYAPLFSIDLTLFNATSLKKYEILESIPACQSIDQATFELMRLDEMLTLARNLSGDAIKLDSVRAFYQSVHQDCKSNIPRVKEALQKAKSKLEET